MTTAYMQRLIAGETPSDEELAGYLAAFHRDVPAATPRFFKALHDGHGATSYDVLARMALSGVAGRPCAILDVGCGDGALVPSLREADSAARIWGIDLSAHEIERARAAFADAHTAFVPGRAQTLPFEDGTFDVAVSHFALMLMQPAVAVLREVARVLRPGGTLACAMGTLPATGAFGELLALAQRFVAGAFPGFRFSATGDARLANDTGTRELLCEVGGYQDELETRDFTVSGDLDADAVTGLFSRAYVFGSLPPALRGTLDAELRAQVNAGGGTVRIDMPVRLIGARAAGR